MQNRSYKQSKLVFIILFMMLINALFVYDTDFAQDALDTYVVQRGSVQDVLSFTGAWLPRDQQILSFDIGGIMQAVNVQPNDVVSAGTVLMVYGTADLEVDLELAQAELLAAQATITTENNEGAILDSQFALANARLSLQQVRDGTPFTGISSASLALEQAKVALKNAERNYNNIIGDPTNGPGAIDGAYDSLRGAESALQSAQIGYWGAAQGFNMYKYSIINAENSLLRTELENQNIAQPISSTQSTAILLEAQAVVDQLTSQIEQSALIAPFDGVVLEVNVIRGDQVLPFQEVMTLAIPDPFEVFVNLSMEDSQRLEVGRIGICEAAGRPETAVQCIVRVIPSGNNSDSIRIAASFDNVTQNETIVVSMPAGVSEDTLWLPPEAIRTFQSRAFVIVQTPEGEQVVDITIGLRTAERVEILNGLNEGDIIIAPES